MERPILTLSTKDFLTGIAPSAHTERGGLFYSATGVTPVYDPGGTASAENGLLQAGSAPTNIGGSTVVDTIFAADSGVPTSTMQAFFYGDSGHIYRLLENGTLTDIRDGGTYPAAVSNSRAGLKFWGSTASGQRGLLYWQSTQIGLWNGSDPTVSGNWDDDYSATIPSGAGAFGTSNWPCPHIFAGNVYWSISSTSKIGALLDNGAGTISLSTNVLDFDFKYSCFSIADDGVYLVLAVSQNQEGADLFANNKILFWDTYSPSWSREYEIQDPFIWKLQRVGNAVYAFGQYGVYEVSFGNGVRKVLSRSIGFGTPTDVTLGYGNQRATTYNQDALIWATDTTIDTLGALDPTLPTAYLKPFKVPSSVGTPSLVFSRFKAGSVYVATDGDKLYRYDFNGSTRETSVSAQTIYFPLRTKTEITRIDVIFGEPLASGDAMSVQLKTDEDTSATPTTALTATYTADGAIRRKSIRVTSYITESPLSLVINFTSGAVKIKRIELYGGPVNTNI